MHGTNVIKKKLNRNLLDDEDLVVFSLYSVAVIQPYCTAMWGCAVGPHTD